MIRDLFAGVATLTMAAALPAAAQTGPVGKWRVEDIGGAAASESPQTTLELTESGEATGNGGCNRYRGTAEFSITAISFSRLAATKMACAPAAMDQEVRFHKALGEVKAWRIDAGTGKLTLLDAKGVELVRLAPLQ